MKKTSTMFIATAASMLLILIVPQLASAEEPVIQPADPPILVVDYKVKKYELRQRAARFELQKPDMRQRFEKIRLEDPRPSEEWSPRYLQRLRLDRAQ